MRKLVSAIIAALFAAVTLSVFAADPVKTGDDPNKPGRQIDDGTVKSGGDTDKPGRQIDDGTVKSGGDTDKPGRAGDEEKATAKKDKEKKKAE